MEKTHMGKERKANGNTMQEAPRAVSGTKDKKIASQNTSTSLSKENHLGIRRDNADRKRSAVFSLPLKRYPVSSAPAPCDTKEVVSKKETEEKAKKIVVPKKTASPQKNSTIVKKKVQPPLQKKSVPPKGPVKTASAKKDMEKRASLKKPEPQKRDLKTKKTSPKKEILVSKKLPASATLKKTVKTVKKSATPQMKANHVEKKVNAKRVDQKATLKQSAKGAALAPQKNIKGKMPVKKGFTKKN